MWLMVLQIWMKIQMKSKDSSVRFHQEKLLLRHKLKSYKFHLVETNANSLIDPEILYGINDDVIEEAVDNVDKLFTPEDMIKHMW